jgi:hypothetical protein
MAISKFKSYQEEMGIHMLLHFMDYLWTVENEGG